MQCHLMHFLCEEIKIFFRHEEAGQERMNRISKNIKELQKTSHVKHVPRPWMEMTMMQKKKYIPLAFEGVFSSSKGKHFCQYYASVSLAKKKIGGKMPAESQSAEALPLRFRKWLDVLLPGFSIMFRTEHTASELLHRHNIIADEAAFEAVHRYSAKAGSKIFPVGLHEWPLQEERMTAFFESCQEKEDFDIPAMVQLSRETSKATVISKSSGGICSSDSAQSSAIIIPASGHKSGNTCLTKPDATAKITTSTKEAKPDAKASTSEKNKAEEEIKKEISNTKDKKKSSETKKGEGHLLDKWNDIP